MQSNLHTSLAVLTKPTRSTRLTTYQSTYRSPAIADSGAQSSDYTLDSAHHGSRAEQEVGQQESILLRSMLYLSSLATYARAYSPLHQTVFPSLHRPGLLLILVAHGRPKWVSLCKGARLFCISVSLVWKVVLLPACRLVDQIALEDRVLLVSGVVVPWLSDTESVI